MQIKQVTVKDYISKSNLPFTDYVINPYIGCPHACKYCYASFIKKFTNHKEDWGSFVDIKSCNKPISNKKLNGKTVVLSSVTDPYNFLENKFEITKKILDQLQYINCKLYIITKSKLVLRDIELLKKQKNLIIAISINTLNDSFARDMDNATSIKDRIYTIKQLYYNNIYTVLFMSPIFPGITDFKEIIELTKNFINEYWFENLNLRSNYKSRILSYINKKYSHLYKLYDNIFNKNDKTYWHMIEKDFITYCQENGIKFVNAFFHSQQQK